MAVSAAASAKSGSSPSVTIRRRGKGRPRSKGPRRFAPLWLSALLLVPMAGLGWLVVRHSAVDATIRTNPVAASVAAPGHPRVVLALAMLEFQTRGGAVSPASRERALNAFSDAPLAEEPLFLAGMSALVGRESARAEQLLAEARRRNPRHRLTRLMLLDRYLRTGRIDAATIEMNALRMLIPDAGGALAAELARLAQSPATLAGLEAALRRNPALRATVLGELADKDAEPDLVLRIARNVPAAAGSPPAAGREWQTRLIANVLARGEPARAYRLWRRFSAPAAPERKAGLYDAEFRGLPGYAPFNWFFATGGAGSAEPKSGALEVDYYGRESADLANQILLLAPGRYRLSFVAEGSAAGEGSRIAWRLRCHPAGAVLGEIPLRGITGRARRIAGEIAIPPGCAAQQLILSGIAGEFPKPQNARIRALSLAAVR